MLDETALGLRVSILPGTTLWQAHPVVKGIATCAHKGPQGKGYGFKPGHMRAFCHNFCSVYYVRHMFCLGMCVCMYVRM